jgi:hypothetical protein
MLVGFNPVANTQRQQAPAFGERFVYESDDFNKLDKRVSTVYQDFDNKKIACYRVGLPSRTIGVPFRQLVCTGDDAIVLYNHRDYLDKEHMGGGDKENIAKNHKKTDTAFANSATVINIDV